MAMDSAGGGAKALTVPLTEALLLTDSFVQGRVPIAVARA